MKKLNYLLLFWVFFGGMGLESYAQLLWKISGNTLKNPSYLYGTIHVTDQRVFQFGDSVLPKFAEVDAFAGEMIFDNSMNMMLETISFMVMPNDTTLSDLLPEKEYLETRTYLEKEFGFMTNYILKFKPILIATMLTEQRSQQKKVVSNGMILDLYFQQLAQEKKMELIGLETFEEQAEAFDGIPLEQQAQMLYQQITSPEPPEDTYEQLLELYLTENLDGLYNYTLAEMDDKTTQKLLIERNIKMANRANKMMPKKSLFIGIGAAHLMGKKGVVQLLRELGYTVEPVKLNKMKTE